MPHVLIKLYAGKSERQKARLAELITRAVMEGTGNGEDSVSVAIQDVEPAAWTSTVYGPDIEARRELLYRMPGYGPLAGAPLPRR